MSSTALRQRFANSNRRDVLITLLGDVARNYVDLRGYQGRLAIAHENIDAQEKALAITRDRFAKGLSSDLDVYSSIEIRGAAGQNHSCILLSSGAYAHL